MSDILKTIDKPIDGIGRVVQVVGIFVSLLL